jgi:hypothetical protein
MTAGEARLVVRRGFSLTLTLSHKGEGIRIAAYGV